MSQPPEIAHLLLGVNLSDQVVKAAEARVQRTSAALNPSDGTVVISKQKVAQETATGKASLARLNQQREQLLQQKGEIQKQLSSNREEIQQLQRDIAATVIRAPASGIIQELNLRNPSQVLTPGYAIAKIAPNESLLVIKALVRPGDIAKVKNNQQVEMRVSACPYTDYGTLKGKVRGISPDAVKPEGKDQNTAATYEVTVQPERVELSSGTRKCAIKSGMEGRADIISSQETVLKFILRKARMLTDL